MKFKISEKGLEWLSSDNTGISSETIFHVITGIPKELILRKFGPGIPHDPSDFHRCYLLLKKFPEWKIKLYSVSLKYPRWTYFIKYWDLLCYLTEQELEDEKEAKKEGYVLYHLIKLFDAIMGVKTLKNQDVFELLLHYTNLKFLELIHYQSHKFYFKASINLSPDATLLNIELNRGEIILYNYKDGEIKKGDLWENNETCPNCGDKANQDIKAVETGNSYCSNECASKHVNENVPEGGY